MKIHELFLHIFYLLKLIKHKFVSQIELGELIKNDIHNYQELIK